MRDTFAPALQEGADFWISPIQDPSLPVVVTVVIPTFQAEATLCRAIQSALDQTMCDIEVIVCDDGSTDSSWSLIADWLARDPRIRAQHNQRNHGKSAVMNCATHLARGRWLAVLDADDWYHRDRLSILVSTGDKSQADMVADNQFLWDAVAERVVGTTWPTEGAEWELTLDDYLAGSDAYEAFNWGMLKPLVRTAFVRATGLSYDEKSRQGEDFLYLLQLFLRGGKAVVSDTALYFYTQPFGTVSRRWSHLARRRYDFQGVYEISRACLRENAEVLTPQQLKDLKTRTWRLKCLENYFRAKESWRPGHRSTFLGCLICHPFLLDYAIRRTFRRYVAPAATSNLERVAQRCRSRLKSFAGEQQVSTIWDKLKSKSRLANGPELGVDAPIIAPDGR
jgi:succinoglycan biosynthesis protein ExoO